MPGDDGKDDRDEWDFRDSRPYWEKMDPKAGLPVWEALFHFVNAALAVQLYELDLFGYGDRDTIDPDWWPAERQGFEKNNFLHTMKWQDLTTHLEEKLRKGELIAYGFSSHGPLDAPRSAVSPERWRDLTIDLKRSAAFGPGLEVTQLRIYAPAAEDAIAPVADRARGYSEAMLRRWYRERVGAFVAGGPIPSRADDYREAREMFGSAVGKRAVAQLRRELAPDLWTRKGRRR